MLMSTKTLEGDTASYQRHLFCYITVTSSLGTLFLQHLVLPSVFTAPWHSLPGKSSPLITPVAFSLPMTSKKLNSLSRFYPGATFLINHWTHNLTVPDNLGAQSLPCCMSSLFLSSNVLFPPCLFHTLQAKQCQVQIW